MIYGKFFVLMLIVFPAVIAQNMYCNKDLCKYTYGTHIGCLNPGRQFGADCKNARIVTITQELRDLFLNRHNMYRNKIARGFSYFPRAVRMAYMEWNDEIAFLSLLNVLQCKMKHDACRNTKKFPNSGQNLYYASTWDKNPNVTKHLISALQAWFNEHNDCPVDVIDKLYMPPQGAKEFLHFTAMVQERNTHVGCAILMSEAEDTSTLVFIACNYAYTNMIGTPVYSKACNSTHPIYKSLCSASEIYKF